MDCTLVRRLRSSFRIPFPIRSDLLRRRPAAAHGIALACVLVWAGCDAPVPTQTWQPSDHQAPAGLAEAQEAELATGTTGAALYAVHCASCHGAEGLGDGPGRPPMAPVVSLASPEFQDSRTDEAIVVTVTNGRGGFMPAFGSRLSAEGIRAVVEHLRTLRRQ